ncbi:unnamed protein product [Amoebophrya sp. A120]|nr:unnamed protein product [Amoebophrya sp. A120]|eukprot:GSA120T00021038001.1
MRRANLNLGEDHVGFSFELLTGCMLAIAVFSGLQAVLVPREWCVVMVLVGGVTLVSYVQYTNMRDQWDESRFVPVAARYMDWCDLFCWRASGAWSWTWMRKQQQRLFPVIFIMPRWMSENAKVVVLFPQQGHQVLVLERKAAHCHKYKLQKTHQDRHHSAAISRILPAVESGHSAARGA